MDSHRLKIWQQNVQGSRVCQEEIKRVVTEKGIDVLLLQEPYTYAGRTLNLEGGRTYAVESKPMAAVIFYRDVIEVFARTV